MPLSTRPLSCNVCGTERSAPMLGFYREHRHRCSHDVQVPDCQRKGLLYRVCGIPAERYRDKFDCFNSAATIPAAASYMSPFIHLRRTQQQQSSRACVSINNAGQEQARANMWLQHLEGSLTLGKCYLHTSAGKIAHPMTVWSPD